MTRNKRIGLGAALVLLSAVMIPQTAAWAASSGFITWIKDGGQAGKARVRVSLNQSDAPSGDISAFQLSFQLEAANGESVREDQVEFSFTDSLKDKAEITVCDSVYDNGDETLTLFLAGNNTAVLEAGKVLELGSLTVSGVWNVTVSPLEAQYVADGNLYSIDGISGQKGSTVVLNARDENTGNNGNQTDQDQILDDDDDDDYDDGYSSGGGGGSKGSTSLTGSTGVSSVNGVYSAPPSSKGPAPETGGQWEPVGNQWKFRLSNGKYASDGWVCRNGQWYHMNQNSIMDTGWYQDSKSHAWYYLKPDGAMKKGWVLLNGVWYHLHEFSGTMSVGWNKTDDKWYYLTPSGAMATGWQNVAGKWYYFSPEEYEVSKRPKGSMYVSEKTPDGYEVDADGARK